MKRDYHQSLISLESEDQASTSAAGLPGLEDSAVSVSDSNSDAAVSEGATAASIVSDDIPTSTCIADQTQPTKADAEREAPPSRSASFYKGTKLQLESITRQFPELETYDSVKNGRKRTLVVCKVCQEYIDEAKKLSKNGSVPIACGIRADGEDRLKLIVDHMQSEVHKAVVEKQKMDLEWGKGSDRHPWLKVLKSHNAQVVRLLVGMAYDVYNDCLCETASANSWPARSLTNLAANRLVVLMTDEGCDAELPPFTPSTNDLHYRDPVYYRHMLESVNAIEDERISKMFDACIAFSIQIDGSLSKNVVDNKFTSCRMVTSDGSLQTVFLKMHSPNESGAQGLLEAVNASLVVCKRNVDKLMGITTDGESANTGKKNGLWKLLSDQLQREILTFWCCAHRSDLASEAITDSVPELNIWKANLVGVSTSFRTSKNKTKLLHAKCPDAKQFPRHHEVRFAEHQVQLIDAILHNLPGCKEVWKHMEENGDRKEKAEARGFQRTWNDRQIWLTELMGDILNIFQDLQKQFQRDNLILCDILTCRDAALNKLTLMMTEPYPGKRESKSSLYDKLTNDVALPGRRILNELVTTSTRNVSAIRSEVVQAAYNFLSERLDSEQEAVLITMKNLLASATCQQFVQSGLLLCKRLFPGREGQFADECCDQWESISAVPHLPEGSDAGCSMSSRLRKLLPVTSGLIQQMLAAIMTLSPHSMQTERIVSHHNLIVDDSRNSMSQETVNARLNIALNGVGTAFFDPRKAVVHFLSAKDRRERCPDIELYTNRQFVQKFFRVGSNF